MGKLGSNSYVSCEFDKNVFIPVWDGVRYKCQLDQVNSSVQVTSSFTISTLFKWYSLLGISDQEIEV